MKRPGLSLVAAAISALALGLGVGGAASATAVTSPHSERTVVVGCLGRAEVRPGNLTLACADGNDYLTGLSWTSWTPKLASGSGVQVANDCIPFCAAGHFHRYPVLVVLWGPAALRDDPGSLRYTQITVIYPGARPEVFDGHGWVEGPATVTSSLWA
jgi:hypothetical protein